MNNLFDGFDLSVSKTSKAKKVAPEELIKRSVPVAATPVQTMTNSGLFDDASMADFNIDLTKPSPEKLAKKLASTEEGEVDAAKVLKSKKVSLEEKLALIKTKVLEVLGKQRKNVVVIKTKEAFEEYISKAIQFGRIAVDTENSIILSDNNLQVL